MMNLYCIGGDELKAEGEILDFGFWIVDWLWEECIEFGGRLFLNADLGFGIWDLGFGIWDLGFGIWDLGFGIWDLGFGI
jgi:hypothetical protein